MTLTHLRSWAAIAALAGLTASQAAQAQKADCITEQQVSAMAVILIPEVVSQVQEQCSGSLEANGFLAVGGDDFIQRFTVLGDANWPMAREAFMSFTRAQPFRIEGDTVDLETMTDDEIRAAAVPAIAQRLTKRIEPKSCEEIERGMEIFAPLPAENMAEAFAFVARLAGVKRPSICEAAG